MSRLLSLSMAILMLLGSLMPHNDMEELTKIPSLISHYQEHLRNERSGHLSFQDFLADHYGSKKQSHQDQDHDNLPFVKHHIPGLIFILPLLSPNFIQTKAEPFGLEHSFPALAFQLLSGYSSHWQPPQN